MSELSIRYRRADAKARGNEPWWHPVEGTGRDQVRALQDQKLREQMAYLQERSAFYQRKYQAAGIAFSDIRSVDDLAGVPFTVKQELRDSLAEAPPYGLHQAADLADIVQMQASSGTTGNPSYVALTESDAEMWQDLTARTLFSCGVRPGDLVLHGFGMGKGFVGGLPVFQAIQYMGAIDIPVGADGGVDRLLRAADDLRPRCVVGAPNFLIHVAEMAPEVLGKPASELGVERVVVGGEPGGGIPAIRNHLQEIWGAKCCELLGGTDLAVAYWGECDDQSGMHDICGDHIIVELLDPETDAVLAWEKGARGELIYTAIGRQASPLVRFRSGDHVEVLDTDCACGRTGPKIRCFGRTDDMLIVRGVNVFPSAIQDLVLAMQPQTNGVMRVLADFEGHTTQGNLKVLVERGPGRDAADDDALQASVEQHLRNALAFKAAVTIVPTDRFEKPGVQKVALTLRETPDFLSA
ncbi:MAG: phenylacetate--CoA ligase family protein [Alphaproteobacteria bacterium]|jgi:phenylacetate-CoA ligase|nr:phenylacetate--CoA ligase family protein [Alphaproteobacteria bacterium]MDP6566278.1 phenylacetate--CoA ligase family protein [Alphaproteobacteria bacterium]MDP6813701.1 phenylacetate--CoA ligase family protein [Alphaproteobacteria bacterium]